jgi:hypothetical protein
VREAAGRSAVACTLLKGVAGTAATSSTTTRAESTTTATATTTSAPFEAVLLGVLAGLAAHRLVGEALLLVEFLLTGGEDKSIATISAF